MSFVERLWFGPKTWQTRCVYWALKPLSALFERISERRKKAYLSGEKPVYHAKVPVVVVGNITAGGNGKTPVVVWLVEQLQQRGLKIGVVSRGYGGKAPQYPCRVTSETPAAWVGDEPLLIHLRTQASVAVAPIRSEAVKILESDVDVIITDDGLQHYALGRDVEFVVIDGERRFGNETCLPAGPLREPCSRLASVDFKICNGGQPQLGEMAMQLQPTHWVNVKTGEKCDALPQRATVAMAGIGHPPRFFATLASLNISPLACHGFADHQNYEFEALTALTPHGELLLMTEKDAVKCQDFALDSWWYLSVSAVFSEADQRAIVQRILDVRKQDGSSLN